MTEPSLNELVRYLDQMRQSFDRLTEQLEKFKEKADRNYVTRELHDLARAADKAEVVEVAKDVEEIKRTRAKEADFRRTVQLALAGIALTSLVSIALALLTLTQGGG